METEYLSVSEFAALYGKDVGNVRRLIAEGRIPAVKIGKQWAIPKDTLPPGDRRVKSGRYRGWRKPKDSEKSE